MFQKTICDGVGSQNGLNGPPLDPHLFWLDSIFNLYFGIFQRIFVKFEVASMVYSRAGGKLIHEKTLKSKSGIIFPLRGVTGLCRLIIGLLRKAEETCLFLT